MIPHSGTMCGSRNRSRHLAALSDRGFDRRQKAKASAANDGDTASDASAQEDGEGDMFSRAGVAAE
jgi:hypothetical protein